MADDKIQSFSDFVQSLSSATFEGLVKNPAIQVESAAAFDEMRRFLINRYRGVEARHSFLESGGQVVDCIPIEQQPSLKGSHGTVATPPPQLPQPAPGGTAPDFAKQPPASPPPQLSPEYKDRFGNQMSCPAGTIPTIRLTLETLSRFRNLQDFFHKAPGGGRLPPGIDKSEDFSAKQPHKYAHAFQNVSNLGGTSLVNTWKPVVQAPSIFALSQHWYVAGNGPGLQTVECGWQVFPQMYNTDSPCLFIYSTRAAYAPGSGCYNTSCGNFVQTDSSVVLGGALQFSQPGGSQLEYQMGYFLSGGNWWFYFGNNPIGYYPGSFYQGGALTTQAAVIDYGGETDSSTNASPQMGSGQFASGGFGVAAYQRAINFFPTGGGALAASLSPQQPSPSCYTITDTNQSASDWGTFMFFGGPGGFNC